MKTGLFGVFNIVLFSESLNPACSIHKLLLPRKKRVACRADFHMLDVYRRSCFDLVPAGTGYYNWFIFRMNAFFHLKLQICFPAASPKIDVNG